MSSTPSAALELAPRPSLRALTILFWLHVGVLVAVLALLRGGPVAAGLAALVAVSWIWSRRHPVFGFGPRALVRLAWHEDGRWTLEDARGQRCEATLLGSSVVHDLVIVLNFRAAGATRSRALLGDELSTDEQRRLRARLRQERQPAV
ncbi:MAG TPA: protein YgfX [Verrucomicrobiae bacterium]|nr:protein YgfX [Verrucomicrobiae bacterium]